MSQDHGDFEDVQKLHLRVIKLSLIACSIANNTSAKPFQSLRGGGGGRGGGEGPKWSVSLEKMTPCYHSESSFVITSFICWEHLLLTSFTQFFFFAGVGAQVAGSQATVFLVR